MLHSLPSRWSRSGLLALGVSAFLGHAGTFKTITIDGSFGDWAGVPVAHEDPADSTDSADYRRIYVANDDEYLYVRITLERPANPFLATSNLFLDADADAATGFPIFLGSELLIQGGSGYDERGGTFNEGAVNGLGWLSAPAGEAAEFELRISRQATFAKDDARVFNGDAIALLLEAEDANFARKETAPDTEGLAYTFAAAPPLSEDRTLVSLTGTVWRVNDTGTDPGAGWRDADFDDSGTGWREGTGLLGYTPTPGAYPAGIATALSSSPATVYLRTRFDWDANPANLVFAVSNLLSDGAVVSLNGVEVRRVRLPAGTVTATTPATGGPAVPGQFEVFGIPGGPLVQGENVLAVELHQTPATPADLVFGLSLTATPAYPVRIVDAAEPADRTVVAGDRVRLTAEVVGTAPLTYEWRRNGEPVGGGTGPELVLDPVLKSDEGRYTLSVTNPGGTAVTREAVLTVTVLPVSIINPALPADVAVPEGVPATFAVAVAGSPPLSYQWLKDGFPINGATDATYTVTSVTGADAGKYTVRVSNPATTSLLSRTATLTVLGDLVPPSLVAASATPNVVTVRFSEAVDPVTAADPSHYQIDGGLTVTAAAVSTANPAVVRLTTTRQTLFVGHTLTVSGVKDRFGNTVRPGSSRTFRSTLAIDGSFDDWAEVPLAHSDPSEAPTAGTDFRDIWVANDDRFLFIRFTLHTPGNPGTFLNNFFFDTDPENPGFGTYGIGSELLIQQGTGYQQKNGSFNEGGIDGLDFAMSPTGLGTDFELRIARTATYVGDRLPVFVSNVIRFFLETENSSFVTTDVAPDSGGLEYTFVDLPPIATGTLGIQTADGKVVLTWTGPGRLQVRESLGSGDWTDVPGAASGLEVSPATSAGYYRLTL